MIPGCSRLTEPQPIKVGGDDVSVVFLLLEGGFGSIIGSSFVNWMVGRFISEWLFNQWSIELLIDGLIDWSTYWLIISAISGWLDVDLLIGWLVGLFLNNCWID